MLTDACDVILVSVVVIVVVVQLGVVVLVTVVDVGGVPGGLVAVVDVLLTGSFLGGDTDQVWRPEESCPEVRKLGRLAGGGVRPEWNPSSGPS